MPPLWQPAPPPKTKLGRYRQLSPLAGIHVSPLCLGGMSIGDKWEQYGMGSMDKASSFKLLDAYYHAGGNFIDTANTYQDESSEEFIGEWMEQRGIRDQMIIATKVRPSTSWCIAPSPDLYLQYTVNFKRAAEDIEQKVHYAGNSTKALRLSVEASLKKLRTEYIDILYLHIVSTNLSLPLTRSQLTLGTVEL